MMTGFPVALVRAQAMELHRGSRGSCKGLRKVFDIVAEVLLDGFCYLDVDYVAVCVHF